jgi:hypothetical protein
MSTFKVVSRDVKTGNQLKKKVYVGDAYSKYAMSLINRWVLWSDIEVYEMYHNKWRLLWEKKKPRTEEEVKKLAVELDFSESFVKLYIQKWL